MRITLMSDLHVEFERRGPDRPTQAWFDLRDRRWALRDQGHPEAGPLLEKLRDAVDLVLLAGDIGVGAEAVRYAAAVQDYVRAPVVMVAGNHELYGHDLPLMLEEMKGLARELGVHLLEREAADLVIAGRRVRVLGATLWTDFELFGQGGVCAAAMSDAARAMTDFRIIKLNGSRFRPEDAANLHAATRAWLSEAVPAARATADSVIVLTHHAPTPLGNPPQHRTSELAPAFASDLEDDIQKWEPDLWVFGHTHHSINTRIGHTRIVAAQRGYVGIEAGAESFRPPIIEI